MRHPVTRQRRNRKERSCSSPWPARPGRTRHSGRGGSGSSRWHGLGHGASAGHLVRRVRVHRRRAAGRGACGAVSTISMPMQAKTAPKAAPDFASRSPNIGRRDRPGQLDGRILDQDRHRRGPAGQLVVALTLTFSEDRISDTASSPTRRDFAALDLRARPSVSPLTSIAEPRPARDWHVAARHAEGRTSGTCQ